jgi:hypothetical protein
MPISPFYPIIYVRGYAMTQAEQDETTADPFCGFNLGSTVYRATPDKTKPAKKFIFESPVVRLMSDYQYADVYRNGADIFDDEWDGVLPVRSIVIYRYYEQASSLLGRGATPTMDDFANGLSRLILRVRDLVCKNPKAQEENLTAANFRCHLVAHSMGGLVCRAFLQNQALGDPDARRCVDRVFTYATPHNGIEMFGLNIPKWVTLNDMSNFNQERMSAYLDIKSEYDRHKRVDILPETAFPPIDRFFCMIGTNRADYEVAMGASRTFAGHGSDGLVRIDNAALWGLDKAGEPTIPAARAYAYRSHSGYFGIVNSEEAYQNLTGFLFGHVRVDLFLKVESVYLPADLQGKAVNALYQFELLAAPRGKRWYLTRRTVEEDSVACRSHQELTDPNQEAARTLYLSTLFLPWPDKTERLAYGLVLGIRVPDYEKDRAFWPNGHYEGRYLFKDSLSIVIAPSTGDNGRTVTFDWASDDVPPEPKPLSPTWLDAGKEEISLPFGNNKRPGISGKLRCVLSKWNQ